MSYSGAVENLTHSLVGATLAELTLPAEATLLQRRLFFTVGVIAANLPDADLVYGGIMPNPLGYLLHHRGHTHTLVGLVGLAALIALVALIPRIRAVVRTSPARFWLLTAAALLSHIVLDSWNSYGVHPFWPFDNKWYYGDSISIFEPWLWILLGLAVGANTRNRVARPILFALPLILVVVAGFLGAITRSSAVVILVVAAVAIPVGFRWSTKRRTQMAFAAATIFVALSFGLSHAAYAAAKQSLTPPRGTSVLDVILSPKPAQPLCFSALTVEKNESAGEFAYRRGDISLGPAPLGCADVKGVRWDGPDRELLGTLRDVVQRDCWARAWMQFGRAPMLDKRSLYDARFGRARAGFTTMVVSASRGCPAHMVPWGMPRADLLGP